MSGDFAEVYEGMDQKVRTGDTPTTTPLGYCNVKRLVGGFEIRTSNLTLLEHRT